MILSNRGSNCARVSFFIFRMVCSLILWTAFKLSASFNRADINSWNAAVASWFSCGKNVGAGGGGQTGRQEASWVWYIFLFLVIATIQIIEIYELSSNRGGLIEHWCCFSHTFQTTSMQCAYACDISGTSIRFVTSRAPRMFFLLLNNSFALGVVVLLSDPSSLVKFCVATQHAHKSRVRKKELTAPSKSVSKRWGTSKSARIRWWCYY